MISIRSLFRIVLAFCLLMVFSCRSSRNNNAPLIKGSKEKRAFRSNSAGSRGKTGMKRKKVLFSLRKIGKSKVERRSGFLASPRKNRDFRHKDSFRSNRIQRSSKGLYSGGFTSSRKARFSVKKGRGSGDAFSHKRKPKAYERKKKRGLIARIFN